MGGFIFLVRSISGWWRGFRGSDFSLGLIEKERGVSSFLSF